MIYFHVCQSNTTEKSKSTKALHNFPTITKKEADLSASSLTQTTPPHTLPARSSPGSSPSPPQHPPGTSSHTRYPRSAAPSPSSSLPQADPRSPSATCTPPSSDPPAAPSQRTFRHTANQAGQKTCLMISVILYFSVSGYFSPVFWKTHFLI